MMRITGTMVNLCTIRTACHAFAKKPLGDGPKAEELRIRSESLPAWILICRLLFMK